MSIHHFLMLCTLKIILSNNMKFLKGALEPITFGINDTDCQIFNVVMLSVVTTFKVP
jgi:hypothetical protein